MNKTVIVGRFTRDPELKFAKGTGKGIVRATIAVDGKKDKDGNKTANFIPVVFFDKTAENVATYMLKGSQIAISGHLQSGKYDKDGTTVFTLDLICEECQFLDKKGSGNSNQNTGAEEQEWVETDSSDIPFN